MHFRTIKNLKNVLSFNVLIDKKNGYKDHSFRRWMSTTRVNIDVAQGTVSGIETDLPNGAKYHAFKGIPYAVPPVGPLRFQAPLPLEKFPQPIQDCSEDGEMCFQRDMTTTVLGSEDCLSLNVYRPAGDMSEKLTVMMWIHGGAFMNGAGSSSMYSPEHLVQENVIVVTVNYRLGPLGFMSFPTVGVEGNAGLKDQLLALKWVNQNIARFGGDPNNVCLFGESAGAAAVHLHLLSENSRPYFHKVICQSGTSTMEWVMQQDAIEKARKLAKVCGYTGDEDDQKLLDYMRALPKEEIAVLQQLEVLTADERRRGLPMPFKPVVEPKTDSSVVTERPLDAMKRKNLFDIPVMIGANDAEGIIMLPNVLKKLEAIDKDLSRYVLKSVNVKTDTEAAIKIGEEIKQFYFGGEPLSKANIPQLIDLLSDYHFELGQYLTLELHARYQHKSPLYFYQFCYDGGLNLYKKIFNLTKNKRACHADEMYYLFSLGLYDVEDQLTAEDREARRRMCRMWTNFAKYGNPTPTSDTTLPCQWKPVQPIAENEKNFTLDCMQIGGDLKMVQNPDDARMKFWRGVFEKWNDNFLMPKL